MGAQLSFAPRMSFLFIVCNNNLIVLACDEHDEDCGPTRMPNVSTVRSCKWRVPSGQVFVATAPSFFETNVGVCDSDEFTPRSYAERDAAGKGFHCEKCHEAHNPCNNSHSACGGCGCSDPGYGPNLRKTMTRLGADNMTTHFDCDYMKQAFKNTNYNVINCTDDDKVKEGNISAIRKDAPDVFNEADIASGIIWGGCTVFPHKIGCRKVPIILEFQCDDCVNKGSAWMLTQCCSKCKQFVDGLESNPLIPSNVHPIGFCSGCDSKNYTFEESPMPHYFPAPWDDHRRFKAYTRERAMEQYDHYVENNICTHLTPHCAVADYDHDGHLEECHTGSCPADPQHFGRRLAHNTKSVEDQLFCPNLGWRQPLSKPKQGNDEVDLDPEEVDPPEEDEPEPVDVIPKAIITMTMHLPGTQEMYQTEEAKTALRHGFANTLEVPESWITVSLQTADGGRRLSDVSVALTINVPSTSTMATTAITQSAKSVNNTDLAMNLQESFAEHAPAINVATVDFAEATVSEVETLELVNKGPVGATEDEKKVTGPPSEPEGLPVTSLAIVGGAVVLGLGLMTAAVRQWWRRSKRNREEANKPRTIGRSQEKEADQGDAKEAPVVPQVQEVPV